MASLHFHFHILQNLYSCNQYLYFWRQQLNGQKSSLGFQGYGPNYASTMCVWFCLVLSLPADAPGFLRVLPCYGHQFLQAVYFKAFCVEKDKQMAPLLNPCDHLNPCISIQQDEAPQRQGSEYVIPRTCLDFKFFKFLLLHFWRGDIQEPADSTDISLARQYQA